MLMIKLINPEIQKPYPHVRLDAPDGGRRTVYAIEDGQPVRISVAWNVRNLMVEPPWDLQVQPRVELLLAFDGRDALGDDETWEDAGLMALDHNGILVDGGVFVKDAPWFVANNEMRRGGKDLAGTVWAAVYMAAEKGETVMLPLAGTDQELPWIRSNVGRDRLVELVEYDSHRNLMERGIVIPLLSPYGPPEQTETSKPEPRIGRFPC